MSEENVEIVRAGFEAWNAGDMDAYRELLDPDVVMRPPEGWPEPGPLVGREAVLREFEQARQAWDFDAAETIADFIDVDDRVVTRMIWHGHGQGPAAKIEMSCLYTVRNGKHLAFDFSGTTPQRSKPPGCGSMAALEARLPGHQPARFQNPMRALETLDSSDGAQMPPVITRLRTSASAP